jgi:type III secretion system TyeA family effector delivery regulator
MQKNFGEGISTDVEGLMDQLFQLVEALRVDHGVIAAIPKNMGARELAWQIYFLTGLYEQLRLLPQKIYPTGDHRTRLLNASQQALDVAIEAEEAENEEMQER